MTTSNRSGWVPLPWLLALAACHASLVSTPAPAPFSTSPWRQPAETLAVTPDEQEAIAYSVLAFYRPAAGKVRWIDERFFPAAQGDSVVLLDPAMLPRLIQTMGSSHWCRQQLTAQCSGKIGGILQLSRPYAAEPMSVRVVVQFRGESGPFAPNTAYAGTEVFQLGRQEGKWVILSHLPSVPQPPFT